MIPARTEAERLLKEAEICNPGPWGNHSRVAARCAEKIAEACGMDPERAYILGLLHDIGRKFGVRHLGHVSDGYTYMMSLGYDEAARICLTHSFNNMTTDEYIGKFDASEEELALIQSELKKVTADDYDRLIQLCDSLAGSEGVMDIEDRMNDVRRRYGNYPQAKWDANLRLKAYFEEKAQKDIYDIVEKDQVSLHFVTEDDLSEVARTWPSDHRPVSEEEARGAISYMRDNYARNVKGCIYHLCLAVLRADGPGTVMGWCGLDGRRSHTEPEIFILLDEEYRGRGYGTQCVKKLLRIASEDFSLRSVHGGCAKDNIASRRAMEKGGMVQYGTEDNGDPLFRS